MNLYHISQNVNDDWDTYSDAVVAAESEDEAKRIHPNGEEFKEKEESSKEWRPDDWAYILDQINVKLIGVAVEGTPKGVVCASFHAG